MLISLTRSLAQTNELWVSMSVSKGWTKLISKLISKQPENGQWHRLQKMTKFWSMPKSHQNSYLTSK